MIARCEIGLPKVYYPEGAARRRAHRGRSRKFRRRSSRPSSLPRDRPARRCLTRRPGAGSRAACATAPRAWDLLDGRSHTLIGTVPPQHMYGFESTVLLALVSGNAFSAERPFYPADIAAAVAAAPRPRALGDRLRFTCAPWSRRTSTCRRWISSCRPPRRCRRIWRAKSRRNSTPACWRSTGRRKPGRSPCAAPPSRPPGGCGRTCG